MTNSNTCYLGISVGTRNADGTPGPLLHFGGPAPAPAPPPNLSGAPPVAGPSTPFRAYLYGRLVSAGAVDRAEATRQIADAPTETLAAFTGGVLAPAGGELLSERQVLESSEELMLPAEAPAAPSAKPAAPEAASPAAKASAASKSTRRVSPRVLKLLTQIGVTVDDFSSSLNTQSARGSRAVAARRAIVSKLTLEGLSAREVAEELGFEVSTVYAHRKAGVRS